ncbi:MAG: glycosyltransferase [Planctomycetes bacterium]|nr:glycosyltransferase [Planctomycetota bacterium]
MSVQASPNPALSIIVPAYNETRRIAQSLDLLRHYAAHALGRIEVIVVDDGSTDGTASLVEQYRPGDMKLRLIVNPVNSGKGYSVRRGMLEATGDALLMCDADMSTPITEVQKMLPLLSDFGVVIGSRAMHDSVLDPPQTFLRWLMNWIFRVVRRSIMLRDVYDTQCGFKLFRRDVARRVFGLAVDNGFAFDCEVLALSRKLGYDIAEVGVVWRNDADSTVRPLRDSFRMLVSLFKIRRRLRTLEPAAYNKT